MTEPGSIISAHDLVGAVVIPIEDRLINALLYMLATCPQLPKCPHITRTLDEARGLVLDEIAYRVRLQAEYADFLDSDSDDDVLLDPNATEEASAPAPAP